jgi:large-conductance mechanosensitive channel
MIANTTNIPWGSVDFTIIAVAIWVVVLIVRAANRPRNTDDRNRYEYYDYWW